MDDLLSLSLKGVDAGLALPDFVALAAARQNQTVSIVRNCHVPNVNYFLTRPVRIIVVQ